MYHMFSKYLTLQISHVTSFLSQVVWLLVHVFTVKISQFFLQILFHAILNIPINKKKDPTKKKPKAVKDRGGGGVKEVKTEEKKSIVF